MSGEAAAAGRGWWASLPADLQDRLVGVVLAAPSSVVLGLSAWLEPAAGGVGTHKQLGLNGCAVLTATGWPCPMSSDIPLLMITRRVNGSRCE